VALQLPPDDQPENAKYGAPCSLACLGHIAEHDLALLRLEKQGSCLHQRPLGCAHDALPRFVTQLAPRLTRATAS